MADEIRPDFRTVRGYQVLNQQEGQLTSALEDYLEMTYRICVANSYARVGKLSEMLHVKPSSASKMISKLAELGYLEYDKYDVIKLTEKGQEYGKYLLYRHQVIERFLNLIGCSNPLEETELIEHSLGPETIENLSALYDFFEYNNDIYQSFLNYRKCAGKKQDTGLT